MSQTLAASEISEVETSPFVNEGKVIEPIQVPKLSKWVLFTASITVVVSGVLSSLSTKLQNRSHNFFAPFWQELIMFCGEFICLGIHFFDQWYFKGIKGRPWGIFEFPRPGELERPRTPFWWWACPTILDLISTALQLIAETITYASTIAIYRNLNLILVAFVTLVVMRRPLRVHEWIGIVIMSVGLTLGALESILTPDDTSSVSANKAWLGSVLSIVGAVGGSIQIIIEEKFLEKHYCPPLLAVGYEGIFGLLMTIPFLIAPHFIKGNNTRGRLIDLAYPWWQMNHDSHVMAGNFLFLLAIVFFNGAGLMTTQLGSGLLRAGLMFACRAPLVWLIELALKWAKYSTLMLFGILLLLIGFFYYSYFIPFVNRRRTPTIHRLNRKPIPCFCTKPLEESDDEEGENASPPSPSATGEFYREKNEV